MTYKIVIGSEIDEKKLNINIKKYNWKEGLYTKLKKNYGSYKRLGSKTAIFLGTFFDTKV